MKKQDVLDLISTISTKLCKERDASMLKNEFYPRQLDYMMGEHDGINRGLSYLHTLREIIKHGK